MAKISAAMVKQLREMTDLSGNNLSGPLPYEMTYLWSLISLFLNDNNAELPLSTDHPEVIAKLEMIPDKNIDGVVLASPPTVEIPTDTPEPTWTEIPTEVPTNTPEPTWTEIPTEVPTDTPEPACPSRVKNWAKPLRTWDATNGAP